MAVQTSDHDLFVEQFLLEDENNVMPLPDIEADPQLLISKVTNNSPSTVIIQM